MPAATPGLALPYPLNTDLVTDGAAAIQALAEATEEQLLAPYLALRRNTAQPLPTTAFTNISWEEVIAAEDFPAPSLPSSTITIPKSGIWQVSAAGSGSVVGALFMVSLKINGVDNADVLQRGSSVPTGQQLSVIRGTKLRRFVAGDTLQVQIFHTQGTDKNTSLSPYEPDCQLLWVRA